MQNVPLHSGGFVFVSSSFLASAATWWWNSDLSLALAEEGGPEVLPSLAAEGGKIQDL